jgi:hypothetical protein
MDVFTKIYTVNKDRDIGNASPTNAIAGSPVAGKAIADGPVDGKAIADNWVTGYGGPHIAVNRVRACQSSGHFFAAVN